MQEDLGAGISLTISGMEDKGFSGTLMAVTDKVITAEEAALLAEQETDASSDRQTENGQEILYPAEDPGIYEEYT